MSLKIVIIRSRASLQPLRDPAKPPAWDNNDGHNSMDLFTLYDGEEVLFSCRAQTVANLEGLAPGIRYRDTIAPGPFQLCAFVEPKSFYGRIHGICNCRTLGGQEITGESIAAITESPGIAGMEGQTHIPRNDARTLMHDRQSHRDKPAGQDTRVAWSAACFVVADKDLAMFGLLLDSHGVKPGDLIDGLLEMEA